MEKDDRPPHQKVRSFIGSKGVGSSLDIWPSRKVLKRLSQIIYLMLDLLYLKRNPLITTLVDGHILLKYLRL